MAPNVLDPAFDESSDRPGFAVSRARLSRQAGAVGLGASLYELPPGQAAFPYHAHLANEEMLIVLRGRPSLRTPDGWRELAEGDVVAFPVGRAGAHQVMNRGDEPVRMLIVSEMNAPELALYPDTGRVGAFETPPGSPHEGIEAVFRLDDASDYWEGERPPGGEG